MTAKVALPWQTLLEADSVTMIAPSSAGPGGDVDAADLDGRSWVSPGLFNGDWYLPPLLWVCAGVLPIPGEIQGVILALEEAALS